MATSNEHEVRIRKWISGLPANEHGVAARSGPKRSSSEGSTAERTLCCTTLQNLVEVVRTRKRGLLYAEPDHVEGSPQYVILRRLISGAGATASPINLRLSTETPTAQQGEPANANQQYRARLRSPIYCQVVQGKLSAVAGVARMLRSAERSEINFGEAIPAECGQRRHGGTNYNGCRVNDGCAIQTLYCYI